MPYIFDAQNWHREVHNNILKSFCLISKQCLSSCSKSGVWDTVYAWAKNIALHFYRKNVDQIIIKLRGPVQR